MSANGSAYPIEAYNDSTKGSHEMVRAVVGGVSHRQLVADYTFVPLQVGEGTIEFDKEQTYLVEEETNKNILSEKDFSNINIRAY